MGDPGARHWLTGLSLYVALGLGLIVLRLIPLSPGKPHWPGPELLLCLTFAWVLRRPDQVPALIVAALFLVEDILFGRPFGLWALFVLGATELLRPRALRWRDQAFVFEWLRVTLLAGLLLIGVRLMMLVFLLPIPPLGPIVLQWLATGAAYPLVVLVLHWVFRLRRPTHVEYDQH